MIINGLIISLLILNVGLLLTLNRSNKKQIIRVQLITSYFQTKINIMIDQINEKQRLINSLQQNSSKLDKAIKKLKKDCVENNNNN